MILFPSISSTICGPVNQSITVYSKDLKSPTMTEILVYSSLVSQHRSWELTVLSNYFGYPAGLRRHVHHGTGVLLGVIHNPLFNKLPEKKKN